MEEEEGRKGGTKRGQKEKEIKGKEGKRRRLETVILRTENRRDKLPHLSLIQPFIHRVRFTAASALGLIINGPSLFTRSRLFYRPGFMFIRGVGHARPVID